MDYNNKTTADKNKLTKHITSSSWFTENINLAKVKLYAQIFSLYFYNKKYIKIYNII